MRGRIGLTAVCAIAIAAIATPGASASSVGKEQCTADVWWSMHYSEIQASYSNVSCSSERAWATLATLQADSSLSGPAPRTSFSRRFSYLPFATCMTEGVITGSNRAGWIALGARAENSINIEWALNGSSKQTATEHHVITPPQLQCALTLRAVAAWDLSSATP